MSECGGQASLLSCSEQGKGGLPSIVFRLFHEPEASKIFNGAE